MTNPYDPTYVPYAGITPGTADNDHVRVLAICSYVWTGLALLFGLFPGMYLFIGIMFLNMPAAFATTPTTTPASSMSASSGAPPAAVGWACIIGGGIGVTFCVITSILALLAGLSMNRRKRFTLIMISAGINCLFMPIGTILGIFMFIVMLRQTVRAQFAK